MESRKNEAVQRRFKNLDNLKKKKYLDNFSDPPGSVILSEIDRILGLPTLRELCILSPSKAEVLDLGQTSVSPGEFYKGLMPEFH